MAETTATIATTTGQTLEDTIRIKADIFLKAALPQLAELVEWDHSLKRMISRLNCVVLFKVKSGDPAAHMIIKDGAITVVQGLYPRPTLTFGFKNTKHMTDFFMGKTMFAAIGGKWRLITLLKVVKLLLKMKVLLPETAVSHPMLKLMKISLLLNMVAMAIQAIVGKDEYATRLTMGARDKVVQWVVNNPGGYTPAAYIIVNAGSVTAGSGFYTKKRPYVTFEWKDLEGAYRTLTSEVGPMESMTLQLMDVKGTPEYGVKVGNLMSRVNEIVNA